METNLDNDLYAESLKAALKVDIISTNGELKQYAVSLYNAAMWGREVDRRNERIRRKNKSLK